MQNKHPQMRLSPDEDYYLRHWMHEEMRYRDGPGLAKRLQFDHGVRSADLAALIAAAFSTPADQEAAGLGPPPEEAPHWPWSSESFQNRLQEAHRLLAARSADGRGCVPRPGRAEIENCVGPVEIKGGGGQGGDAPLQGPA
jgi:hypothetical protein